MTDRQELRAQINAAFSETFAYLADVDLADTYRRLIASYMVETVAPDPAQEESWQEPLRQPDDD